MLQPIIDITRRMLGTTNENMVRRYLPMVRQVNDLGPAMERLDDAELKAKTANLRDRLSKGAKLSDLRVEAFAIIRETADRRLGMWNAFNPEKKFPQDAWGNAMQVVGAHFERITAARERLAKNEPGEMPWDIELPASVYAAIRTRFPESLPPFRMRPFDVQIIGAAVLDEGMIAEMRTGEGKTLVAGLAAFVNGLTGKGVHVVTVNDYLARRDANWNAPMLRFLGVSIGAIQSEMHSSERKAVYAMDVTYGTNNEFGFDYLRDNLARDKNEQVQVRRTLAIVDEVDSVLIDEARTPLIISGPSDHGADHYIQADEIAKQLVKDEDFEVDIKDRHITLSEAGIDRAAKLFGVENMYQAEHMHLPHFLDNALKAHHLYFKDKEYLVTQGRDPKVKIIDEFRGRVLEGRRWSDGLHQAMEAKERVRIEPENQTVATITLQNFFRLYTKLAGMTGTAMTEANEFNAIYKLVTIAIPTNRKVVRQDFPDLIYGSMEEKWSAIASEVIDLHAMGQPMLVGTVSVASSERLSEVLKQRGVRHEVLNARHHEKEADIVARAGHLGSVTIATNMAGRGTDIILGSNTPAELLAHWQANEIAPRKLSLDSPELDEAIIDCWATKWLGADVTAKLRPQGSAKLLNEINKERKQRGWHQLELPSAILTGPMIRLSRIGGLRVIGTERHESRRIDNQLRGRSGRQGDPGSSRFFLSLEDDLWKRFAPEGMRNFIRNMGLKDGVPVESRMLSGQIEKAQKKVEEVYYGQRRNTLEYDEVMNMQRKQVYTQRQRILDGESPAPFYMDYIDQAFDDLVQKSAEDGTRGDPLARKLAERAAKLTGFAAVPADTIPVREGGDACRKVLAQQFKDRFATETKEIGQEKHDELLRDMLLMHIDKRWKSHLYMMDHLRHSSGLVAYGQKDPKLHYKEQGFAAFNQMYQLLRQDMASNYLRNLEYAKAPQSVQAPMMQGPSREQLQAILEQIKAMNMPADQAIALLKQLGVNVVVEPAAPTPEQALMAEQAGTAAEGRLLMGGFAPRPAALADGESEPLAGNEIVDTPVDAEPMKESESSGPQAHDPCPCGSGKPFSACHGYGRMMG